MERKTDDLKKSEVGKKVIGVITHILTRCENGDKGNEGEGIKELTGLI